MLEDPQETLVSQGQQFFDTDVIHGTPQRVRPSQLFDMVEPLINHSSSQLNYALNADRMVHRLIMHVCGSEITRIARGFLWRIRVAEFRKLFLQNVAAITIQSLWRGLFVRKYIVPLFKAQRSTRCAIVIQRITRGCMKRLWFQRVMQHRRQLLEAAAAVRIQATVRGWTVYKDREEIWEDANEERAQWDEYRQVRLERARKRRWKAENEAACNIQRMVRGLLARREAYMRRQQGFISHPRVRELADAYLSGGDLWGLLATINMDYERRETSVRNDQVQMEAFIKQMQRLREEKADFDPAAWEEAKLQLGISHLPPQTQTMDAKMAVMEQLYLPGKMRDMPASRSGTRFVVKQDSNRYLQSSTPAPSRNEQPQLARGENIQHRPRSSSGVKSGIARGPEDPGQFEVGAPSAVTEQHRFSASRQPLHQPIDGSHPLDQYIPAEVTGVLATKPNALGETPEEVRRRMQAEQPAVQTPERKARSFSIPSPMQPELGRPRSLEDAVFHGANSLAEMQDAALDQRNLSAGPFHSGKITTWNRPLVPGGSLVGEDGYFRPSVMNSALSQIDRLASKAMIQAQSQDDGRPVSPATMLLLRVKSKKQAADREDFKRKNKALFAEESKHLDAHGDTYQDEHGATIVVQEEDAIIQPEDSPRTVVSKKMKALALESATKSSSAGAQAARSAAQASRQVGENESPRMPAKTYRQVKYEAILATARSAAAGIVSAIAETIDSMIIRERMDERTAEAIASGTTAAGAGPHGFSKLAASGIMNTVSLGALSRATSRATTPALNSRPASRARAASVSQQTTRLDFAANRASSVAAPGGKPHIKREGTIASKTFTEITKMGYHVLHGRGEISNPAGVQVAAQLADAERVADARRKAKENVRRERYYSAMAERHEGGERIAAMFGISTDSVQGTGTDVQLDEEFNDEPLAVHNGVRLGDNVEEAIRKEQLVQAYTSGGMPNVHSLLRDVRGMKGPLDALIIHATLRTMPVPEGVIKWAKRAAIPLSTELLQLSAQGKPLLAPPEADTTATVADSSQAHIAADPSAQPARVGEEAAKIFSDMPAGMVKVQWERLIRERAAPIVAILARSGCETAGDVANIDLSKLPIELGMTATIKRLLHIIRASQKLSSAGVVREVFASAPPPIQPPLLGPYSALHNSSQQRLSQPSSFLQKPGAEGEFDVNQSSSQTYGTMPSYDPPGGSRLLGLNLDSLRVKSSAPTQTQRTGMLSASITPRAKPKLNSAPSVVVGSAPGGLITSTQGKSRKPIAVVHALDTSATVQSTNAPPSSHVVSHPRSSASLARSQAVNTSSQAGVRSIQGSRSQEVAVDDETQYFVQAGLYTGFGAGYTSQGKSVRSSELQTLAAAVPGRFLTQSNSESELLRSMHEQQAREKSNHMAKFFKQPIETGIPNRKGEHLDEKLERLRIPRGFSILERDDALSAPALRTMMQRREHIVDFQAEVQEMMGSKLGKGLAFTRRRQEIDAKKRSEELQKARKDSEETLKAAKRTAFQIYYEEQLGGISQPTAGLSSLHQEAAARQAAESSITELLSDMERSLNGLSLVTDLDSPIDPALIQVAFTLPIPCPRLTAMSDHRTQVSRSDNQRLKVLVPYNLFLRQLISYHLPAQSSKKMDDVSGTKKQRMLIKERTKSASIIARFWTAALQRWGYDRIGQLVNVPKDEMCRIISSGHPIQRAPGMTPLEKACAEVCSCIEPQDVATSLRSALQHWQQMSPETFKTVKQSWASFDRKFQRGPNDINGRPEIGRKLAQARRQKLKLKSANWSTFSKSFHSETQKPNTGQISSTAISLPSIDAAESLDGYSQNSRSLVKPLLSPLWFAGNSLDPKAAGFLKSTEGQHTGDGTAGFLVDFVADDVEEERHARNVHASAGGTTLPRDKFIAGAPKMPPPIDSTVKYVKNSTFTSHQRDSMGLTAAGAVPMEWQYSVHNK